MNFNSFNIINIKQNNKNDDNNNVDNVFYYFFFFLFFFFFFFLLEVKNNLPIHKVPYAVLCVGTIV